MTNWVSVIMCVCHIYVFLAQSNVTDSVMEVVAYEARRLFRDRLVSSKDLHTFDNILSSIIQGDWGSDAIDNMTGMRQLCSYGNTFILLFFQSSPFLSVSLICLIQTSMKLINGFLVK